MRITEGDGANIDLQLVEMRLELFPLAAAHETEIPEVGIACAFPVAFKQQTEVGIVQPIDATANIEPSRHLPDGGKLLPIPRIACDFLIRVPIQNHRVWLSPETVKENDFVGLLIPRSTEESIRLLPSNWLEHAGVVQQETVIIGRCQEIPVCAQRLQRIQGFAV